jgi:hypothetical protein
VITSVPFGDNSVFNEGREVIFFHKNAIKMLEIILMECRWAVWELSDRTVMKILLNFGFVTNKYPPKVSRKSNQSS